MLIELDYPGPIPVELDAHPDGALYIGAQVRKIIPRIAKLRESVRQAGGRVVHTQSVRSPDALEFKVFKNTVRKLFLFTSFGYRHNVTVTRSDLIKLRPSKILP